MRFIGKIGAIKIRTHVEEYDTRSQAVKVAVKGINAEFEQGTLTDYEVEQGLEKLGPFVGMPIYEDEVTPVSPRVRLRVYDTDTQATSNHWDAETKDFVEQTLLNHELYGREFIAVEEPKVPAPWPNYPKLVVHGQRKIGHVVEQIVAKITEDGYLPAEVIAYERANLNRPEVIEGVEALTPEPAKKAEELVVEA